jgi:hypothetical protein
MGLGVCVCGVLCYGNGAGHLWLVRDALQLGNASFPAGRCRAMTTSEVLPRPWYCDRDPHKAAISINRAMYVCADPYAYRL